MPRALSGFVDWVSSVGDVVIRAVTSLVSALSEPPSWLVPPPPALMERRRCAYCGQRFVANKRGACQSCGAPEE